MVKLTNALSKIKPCRILLAGDLLLDSYTIGKAGRISPEAPVAVVQVTKEELLPGGAGNVALNLISLGAHVKLLARVGPDSSGRLLKEELAAEGISLEGVFEQPDYRTPLKNRIIADNQQIVRVDHEQFQSVPEQLEQQLINQIPELLKDVEVVAISDYGKGFLTDTLLQALIQEAKSRKIPVLVDPKGSDFQKYAGATIVKPNASETYAAAKISSGQPIEKAAMALAASLDIGTLMVTRSEKGISLFHADGSQEDFPVKVRQVKDVTGAGDTVLAALAVGVASRLDLASAVRLSNMAAGIAIEQLGCARVTLSDIARRALEYDVDSKVFDYEHLFVLKEAIKAAPYSVVHVKTAKVMTPELFHSIKNAHAEGKTSVLIFVEDKQPDNDFIHMLASLHEVSFVLICPKTFSSLIEETPPLMSIPVC